MASKGFRSSSTEKDVKEDELLDRGVVPSTSKSVCGHLTSLRTARLNRSSVSKPRSIASATRSLDKGTRKEETQEKDPPPKKAVSAKVDNKAPLSNSCAYGAAQGDKDKVTKRRHTSVEVPSTTTVRERVMYRHRSCSSSKRSPLTVTPQTTAEELSGSVQNFRRLSSSGGTWYKRRESRIITTTKSVSSSATNASTVDCGVEKDGRSRSAHSRRVSKGELEATKARRHSLVTSASCIDKNIAGARQPLLRNTPRRSCVERRIEGRSVSDSKHSTEKKLHARRRSSIPRSSRARRSCCTLSSRLSSSNAVKGNHLKSTTKTPSSINSNYKKEKETTDLATQEEAMENGARRPGVPALKLPLRRAELRKDSRKKTEAATLSWGANSTAIPGPSTPLDTPFSEGTRGIGKIEKLPRMPSTRTRRRNAKAPESEENAQIVELVPGLSSVREHKMTTFDNTDGAAVNQDVPITPQKREPRFSDNIGRAVTRRTSASARFTVPKGKTPSKTTGDESQGASVPPMSNKRERKPSGKMNRDISTRKSAPWKLTKPKTMTPHQTSFGENEATPAGIAFPPRQGGAETSKDTDRATAGRTTISGRFDKTKEKAKPESRIYRKEAVPRPSAVRGRKTETSEEVGIARTTETTLAVKAKTSHNAGSIENSGQSTEGLRKGKAASEDTVAEAMTETVTAASATKRKSKPVGYSDISQKTDATCEMARNLKTMTSDNSSGSEEARVKTQVAEKRVKEIPSGSTQREKSTKAPTTAPNRKSSALPEANRRDRTEEMTEVPASKPVRNRKRQV